MAQISFSSRRKLEITQNWFSLAVLQCFALMSGLAHVVLLRWDCSLIDP